MYVAKTGKYRISIKFSFHMSNNLEVWLNQVFFALCQLYMFQLLFVQGVPEYMTQFQNFIKNRQVKIQRKLKYFLKGYEMPFHFSSLLQVVLKIVSLKWRLPMLMQF